VSAKQDICFFKFTALVYSSLLQDDITPCLVEAASLYPESISNSGKDCRSSRRTLHFKTCSPVFCSTVVLLLNPVWTKCRLCGLHQEGYLNTMVSLERSSCILTPVEEAFLYSP
jgi:hypothetical protein